MATSHPEAWKLAADTWIFLQCLHCLSKVKFSLVQVLLQVGPITKTLEIYVITLRVLGASSFASAGGVASSGFVGAPGPALSAAGPAIQLASGPGLPIAASGPGFQVASGPGVPFTAGGPAIGVGPAGALGGPDLHSAEPHYHLGHTVQRHVTVLHRIGVPVPRPYQVQVERRVPVQVCAQSSLVCREFCHNIHIQVPTPVDVPVDRPYPVHVNVPYEVKVYKDVPVQVDQPIPVPVSVPVHINIPEPVKVEVPVPVPFHIVKKIPVPVPHPIIVKKKVPVAIHAHIETVAHHGPIEVHQGPHGWD